MMSSKPQIPVTNLRERIAALEQRNAASGQRSASPSQALGGLGTGGGGTSVGGLKDKIARFEKKGGVPIPRGTFGLGAPPPQEARVNRNPELYGNRIPQPVRMVSANHTGNSGGPPSRSGSSLGFYISHLEYQNTGNSDWRRSVSMSSVITDLDGRPDYTPLTSPTFDYPDSPGSTTTGAVFTPEGSPTIAEKVEVATVTKAPIVPRSTSFAKAVEMANKVADGSRATTEKLEGSTPTPFIVNTAAIKRELEAVEQAKSNGSPRLTNVTPVVVDTAAIKREFEEAEKVKLTDPDIKKEPVFTEPTPVDVVVDPSPTPPTVETPVQIVVHEEPAPTEPIKPSTSSAIAVEESVTTVLLPPEPKPEPAQPISHVEAPESPPPSKPVTRNNKDLTLNVEALKTQDPSVLPVSKSSADETTPTTASYPHLLTAPTSALSSDLSSGSASRPFSMGELAWAERVTPATSRGNVMFIPPTSTLPRKSDLVNYPETPTEEAPEPPQPEPKASKPASFTAVVHEKVREAETPLPPIPRERSQTPRKQKRMTMMPLPSPGGPELFSLIQNAVLLESSLEQGELPTELAKRKEEEERERKALQLASAIAADKARSDQEELKKLAFQNSTTSAREAEEEISARAKLRHTFLIPLSKARSQHRKEASTSSLRPKSAAVTKTSDLPDLPERLPSPGAESAPSPPPIAAAVQQTRAQPPPVELQQAPKSAGANKSRFSSFHRLTSVKSVIGAAGRASISRKSMASDASDETTSSSIPAVITPEGSIIHEDVDEFGITTGYGQEHSWPSLSPKKSGSLYRASTFAGKMFSRSRTKSSGSTLSNMSDTGTRAASVYTLPPLPGALSVIPGTPEYETRQPRRSISLKSLKSAMKGRTSTDSSRPPPVPSKRKQSSTQPPASVESTSPTSTLGSPGYLKSPDYLGYGFNPPPPGKDDARPMSWVSVSSLSSTLPSPLFDQDIFDAFPAVPSGPPANGSRYTGDQGLQTAALMTPSFDSAFLGTALHLSGSSKAATPNTATGVYAPLPPLSAAANGSSTQSFRSTTRRDKKF